MALHREGLALPQLAVGDGHGASTGSLGSWNAKKASAQQCRRNDLRCVVWHLSSCVKDERSVARSNDAACGQLQVGAVATAVG